MLKDIHCKCQIVKNFSPSWFASVMGTGILAIVSGFFSNYLPILNTFSKILFHFNVFLFFILLIPWLLRWIFFKKEALKDLSHPILSNFYSTIAVGLLVLSANFIIIGKNILVGRLLWIIGAIGTIFFAILTPYIMFKGEHVKIDHINPAWFIPPVGLIVIPIAGSLIINSTTGVLQELVILVNYFGWGAGFFLYLALLAVSIYRFILHKPLPNTLAPTIWINLGPIGAGTAALISLVNHSYFIKFKEPFHIFGFFFWGFGIWWLLMAITMTIYYIKRLKLPYAMSWWAFTFPLGAYISATYSIWKIFKINLINYFGFGLYILLLVFWFVTFFKTIVKVYHGTLFKD